MPYQIGFVYQLLEVLKQLVVAILGEKHEQSLEEPAKHSLTIKRGLSCLHFVWEMVT